MRNWGIGRAKWVFVDWMGVEPGYGTQWGGAITEGWSVPHGITLKVHEPAVDHGLAIAADRPWEQGYISAYSTFLEDGGTLRCWYENGGGIGYAESDDGITWRKPTLGLQEWNGSTENNLIDINRHGHGIFIDPVAGESERYKMVSCHWTETERKVLGAVSADGLHWTPLPRPLMEHQHADTQNIALYDAELSNYVLYTRQMDAQSNRRGVNRTVSDNFRHFPDSDPVLENNPIDAPDLDIYCNGYSPWPGATDAHLMRLSMYERTPDTMNVHLATSRDGIFWHRPLGQNPWIETVPSAGGPYKTVYACAGVIPTGNREWSTYVGVNRRMHNEPLERKTGALGESGLVRASLREDGFISLSSRGRGGFWTVPFELNSDSIRVNAHTLYSGFLRCQILSSSPGDVGSDTRFIRPIDGYTLEDCQPLVGDYTDAPLTWNGSADLSHLRGQTIRLRFDLFKADLYAIRF